MEHAAIIKKDQYTEDNNIKFNLRQNCNFFNWKTGLVLGFQLLIITAEQASSSVDR
jgi:hypothetical protein